MIKARDALLTRWLDPHAEGTKVVDGVAPSLRQLAADLSAHFRIRSISARAVWHYVQEARASSGDTCLVTRPRGRPSIQKQEVELAGPKRPRGRPRRIDYKTGATSGDDIDKEARPKSRRVSAVSQNADLLAQLAAEALQLTGMTPSTLHRTFFGMAGWDAYLGQRSGFFYRLKKLDCPPWLADTSASRPDDDIEHSLRLHQVVLHTQDGLWCALLLGYEPRSHFLNVACYVAHPVEAAEGRSRLAGRPVKRLHRDWRCTRATEQGRIILHLPPEAILAFASETRALMAVPMDTVWLSSSLGNHATLIPQLQTLAPAGKFESLPRPHQTFVPPEAGMGMRVTTLCRILSALLDQHYQDLAYARLGAYQERGDQIIETAFHIRALPSGRQIYRQRKLPTILGESEASKAKRELAEAFVEYRKTVSERLHVKHRLSIVPIHLPCDID